MRQQPLLLLTLVGLVAIMLLRGFRLMQPAAAMTQRTGSELPGTVLMHLPPPLPTPTHLTPPMPPTPTTAPSTQARMAASSLPPAPKLLTITFGTSLLQRFVYNWLAHARLVSALRPYAVLALDRTLHEIVSQRWFEPALDAIELLQHDGNTSLDAISKIGARSSYLRAQSDGFKLVGYVKARSLAVLLRRGYSVLITDADSVFLRSPWPWIAPSAASFAAADAGMLPSADVLIANDYPDMRRDGQPDTVLNSGVLFLRARAAAIRLVEEWSVRTLRAAGVGNDQTELNRLLKSHYRDGDFACNHDGCLLPERELFVPSVAVFAGAGCESPDLLLVRGRGSSLRRMSNASEAAPEQQDGPCPALCMWHVSPTEHDAYSGLQAVPLSSAMEAWRTCRAHNEQQGRRIMWQSRQSYWLWGGRVRVGILPMAYFMHGHTYFVQELHYRHTTKPAHVHATFTNGGAFGKEWRLRSARLWHEMPLGDQAAAANLDVGRVLPTKREQQGRDLPLLRVTGVEALLADLLDRMHLPEEVWSCEDASATRRSYGYFTSPDVDPAVYADRPSSFFGGARRRCFHPRHLVPSKEEIERAGIDLEAAIDPAAPQLAMQLVLRTLLRNAFALAFTLRRTLVLPRLWALCEKHWWQLVDCRTPGNEVSQARPAAAQVCGLLTVALHRCAGAAPPVRCATRPRVRCV